MRQRLVPLLEHGLVATCSFVDLEILFSCRTAHEYEEVLLERRGFERVDIEQGDWDTAGSIQRQLARVSKHRAAGIADLVLAALAQRHRLVVLHYDQDFDHIAEVSGQQGEWVVPRGSVP